MRSLRSAPRPLFSVGFPRLISRVEVACSRNYNGVRPASTIPDHGLEAGGINFPGHAKTASVQNGKLKKALPKDDSKGTSSFQLFERNYPDEIRLLKSFLASSKVDVQRLSKKDQSDLLNRFKIVSHFGKPSLHSKKPSLRSISTFCTLLKQDLSLFRYLAEARLTGSPFEKKVPEKEVPEKFLRDKDDFAPPVSAESETSFKYNTEERLEQLLNNTVAETTPKTLADDHGNILFKDVLSTSLPEASKSPRSKELHLSDTMEYLQAQIVPKVKRSDLQEDLSDINAERIRATYKKPITSELGADAGASFRSQETLDDFQEFLKSTQKDHEIKKEDRFRQQNAFEWSRSKSQSYPRLLEEGNFFTPRCIPKTLIPIKDVRSVGAFARADLLFPNTPSGRKEFLILVGRKKIVTQDNPLGNDSLPEDMFTIFGKMKHPEKFMKRVSRLQRRGWKLIGGGGPKEFLVFQRSLAVKRRLLTWVKSFVVFIGTASLSLFAVSFMFE
ncbi:unnamed protein product [Kuraishia capsulata CBS 1993]|uniref:Uncharacterized protein n=1 Tax=Kuraishia capsulata CBS 1993 TaxID=1382522 RepID=W6MP52_9ASCO|nr:uncharacterized protein KUCA_T00004436001 [Kuraishia capsulata CBS 1993]CDK28454.1 unnamed protein product [Kuraishia capsulata CBS 1993]